MNLVLLGYSRVEDEEDSDSRRWGSIRRNWDLRDFRVQVDLPFPIRQRQFPIRAIFPPIWGSSKAIRQVVPLISHICVNCPYCTHCHPQSLFPIYNSTIIAEHKVKSSLSIAPCHYHLRILSIADTEYSIHQVKHTRSSSIHCVHHSLNLVCFRFMITN
jgi:hypothetical protein